MDLLVLSHLLWLVAEPFHGHSWYCHIIMQAAGKKAHQVQVHRSRRGQANVCFSVCAFIQVKRLHQALERSPGSGYYLSTLRGFRPALHQRQYVLSEPLWSRRTPMIPGTMIHQSHTPFSITPPILAKRFPARGKVDRYRIIWQISIGKGRFENQPTVLRPCMFCLLKVMMDPEELPNFG